MLYRVIVINYDGYITIKYNKSSEVNPTMILTLIDDSMPGKYITPIADYD